jgi:FkbH-like protein
LKFELPSLTSSLHSTQHLEESLTPPIDIGALRNITVEPIDNYYSHFLIELGLTLNWRYGNYDNVVQDAVTNPPSLKIDQLDYLLVFLNLRALSPLLADRFAEATSTQVSEETNRITDVVRLILSNIRAKTNATVIWHSFETPIFPCNGPSDYKMEHGQVHSISQVNRSVQDALTQVGDSYLVEVDPLVRYLGASQFYDSRYWQIARAPYSKLALQLLAHEGFKIIRELSGHQKKCLVLDCDNTLWGGILGEVGSEGIQLGPSYPGSCFLEFQEAILQLHQRGVIIVLASKNNENDVLDVLTNHPYMRLRREHISAYQINWNNKAENISKIADTLKLGLDSFVFVDDSPMETELVNSLLPEVTVVSVADTPPSELKNILFSSGLFDTLSVSQEDRKRGKMYKDQEKRIAVQHQYSDDLAGFLTTTEMELNISLCGIDQVPRIAQLSQRTNQFNFTLQRFAESEIFKFVDRPDCDVIVVQLTDKFGDMGIIGSSILRYESPNAEIINLLLSCRALGREVETQLLNAIANLAASKNCSNIFGQFKTGPRNLQVHDLLTKQSWAHILWEKDGTTRFEFLFNRLETGSSRYFKNICSKLEATR